jgi:very-short-patch-repair endonuclease
MDVLRSHDPRYRQLHVIARRQAGVMSRRQLYALGITRWEVTAHVRALRWRTVGDQAVCLHTGPLTDEARHWAAVFQGGPRAHLDGASALIAAGLKRFQVERIRVSVPRGARVRRTARVDIRQTRRWAPHCLATTGVPRTLPAMAAVRAALWATSDKQAALVLTMTVQQGLATGEELAEAALTIRRDRRRRLVHDVILDVLGGAESLGELDVARECRRRGLPEPTRQVLRRDGARRYFLDVYWEEWGVVLEIDGIHHGWAENVVTDALRHNAVALQRDVVLRLPLLGLRVARERFFEQVEEALRGGGWRRTAA